VEDLTETIDKRVPCSYREAGKLEAVVVQRKEA
jgi:hypothetical protein